MSIQKYLEQKQGGAGSGSPLGDIKNNDALKAAAEAGRAALKKINAAVSAEDEKQKQMLQKKVVQGRMICNCGDPSCRIGPFTIRY